MSFTPEQLALLNEGRQKLQSKQGQQNLQGASQEQLFQLAKQKLSEQKPQERRSTFDILGDIFGKLSQVPGELKELGFEGLKQQFIDEFTSPEQSPFEEGLGFALRDVGAPIAGALPDLAQTAIDATRAGGDFVGSLFGLPGSEEIAKQTGVQPAQVPFQTKQLQGFIDEATDGQFANAPDDVKLISNIAKDGSLLAAGGGGLVRSIATSALSNLAARGLVDADVIAEENEDLAKVGFFISSAFIRPGAMKDAAKRMFGKAEEAMGSRIITDNLVADDIKDVIRNLRSAGGETLTRNKEAISFAESLLTDMESGTFEGKNIIKGVRNLNEKLGEFAFDKDFEKFKQSFGQVRQALQGAAERAGVSNPEFINAFNESNSLWSAIHTRNTVGNYVKQKLPKKLFDVLSPTLKKYLSGGIEAVAKPVDIPIDFMRRLKEPSVQRFWRNFIVNVMEENFPAANENLKNLDNEIKKDDKK